MSKKLHNQANALIIQRQQTNAAQNGLNDAKQALGDLEDRSQVNQVDLDNLLALSEAAVAHGVTLPKGVSLDMEVLEIEETRLPIAPLDHVSIEDEEDWEGYLAKVQAYAARNELTLHKDPFAHLMSPTQKIALEKRIREDFSLKAANCDKFDYMIAGTCGLIGGLVDVLFVGVPGEGALTNLTDKSIEKIQGNFADFLGFDEKEAIKKYENYKYRKINDLKNGKGSGPIEIERYISQRKTQFIENKFKVNYDQTTTNGVKNGTNGHVKNLKTKNHHVKSIGHWPDFVGLFFSIMDQFTSKSHFVDGGSVVSIDTKTFKLHGRTFIAKIFAGFVNWLGHLMSDIAGSNSSIAKGNRGSGIPIPFFGLLQFIDVGEFGQHRQSFAKVAVQVFEQGYDFRHGMALAIPVMVTELLTRIMWTFKRRFSHGLTWGECLPSANNPELRRMLLVGHGTLCIVDGVDAALRSGGEMINFMLRANLIAWARFGSLALKELRASYGAGSLDTEAVDEYLEKEYQRLLS